jgi:hypothetical protein
LRLILFLFLFFFQLTEEVEEPSVYSKHQFYSEYPKSNQKSRHFSSNRKLNVQVNKPVDDDLNISDVFSDKSLTDFQKVSNPSEKPKKKENNSKIKEQPVKYFINYPILSDSGLNNLDNSVSYVSGMNNNDNSSSTKSISKSNSNLMDSESSTVILNSFKLY